MACINDDPAAVFYLFIVFYSLSLIGSAFVIIICFSRRFLEDFTLKVVLYMSINDFARSCFYIINQFIAAGPGMCKAVVFFVNLTLNSNIIWGCCISITLYLVLVKQSEDYAKYHKHWLLLSYIVLPGIEALPFITNSYGTFSGVCTIDPDIYGTIWRFSIYYFPNLVALGIIGVLYIKIYKVLKYSESKPAKDLIFQRGYIYAIIMAIQQSTLILSAILITSGAGCNAYFFVALSGSFVALHGMLNAGAFFLNQQIRNAIFKPHVAVKELKSMEISKKKLLY